MRKSSSINSLTVAVEREIKPENYDEVVKVGNSISSVVEVSNNIQDISIVADSINNLPVTIGAAQYEEVQTTTTAQSTGDTPFTLTITPINDSNLIVYVQGVRQNKTAYTFNDVSNTVTFNSEYPDVGDKVSFVTGEIISTVSIPNASVVPYTPQTGVITNVAAKLSEFVSVKDFGAVGDGITNDRNAIITALASAAGKTLYFPEGTYKVTGVASQAGLTISNANTKLVGSGADSCSIVYTGVTTGYPVISITASNVHIEGITVDGTANATKTTEIHANTHGIEIKDQTGCVIKDNKIIGGHYCIALNNTTDDFTDDGAYTVNKNHNIIGNTCSNSYSTGIWSNRISRSLISDNTCDDNRIDGIKVSGSSRWLRILGNHCESNSRDGIDFYDGIVDSVVDGNVCIGNTLQGMEVKGTLGGTFSDDDYVTRNTLFSNNIAENNGSDGFSFNSVRNSNIVGNTSNNNALSGYRLDTTQGCNYTGNIATRNTRHGFDINSSVSRTSFTGCFAVDNSWVDGVIQNGTYNGFNVASGSESIFTGCQALNGTTANKKGGQGYAFSFASSGSYITGCYTLNNVTGEIQNINNVVASNVNGGSGLGLNAFGSFTSNSDALVTGYVSFTDDTGTVRKLATIA